MTMVSEYLDIVIDILARIRDDQSEDIALAAQRCADCIREGGLIHVFGSGHSSMVAQDLHARAGGLTPINWIVSDDLMPFRGMRSAAIERIPGLAAALLDHEPVQRGDVLIVVSQSGRNAVPVEMAENGKERGLFVIAITSLAHSRSVESRAPSRRRLFEIADLVIDNLGAPGDAAISVDHDHEAFPAGPTSTVVGSAIGQAIAAETVARLALAGIRPPMLRSGNEDGTRQSNDRELSRLSSRTPSLLASDIARLNQSRL